MPISRSIIATPYPAEPRIPPGQRSNSRVPQTSRTNRHRPPPPPPHMISTRWLDRPASPEARSGRNAVDRQNDHPYRTLLHPKEASTTRTGPPTHPPPPRRMGVYSVIKQHPSEHKSGNKILCRLVMFSKFLWINDPFAAGHNSSSFRPSQRRCTSSSCSDAVPEPFLPAAWTLSAFA